MPSSFNFDTGPSPLPDIGTVSYNGAIFSPLFASKINGNIVKDNANRVTKVMEYRIELDGYVTLASGNTTISPTIGTLRTVLTQQGGVLSYRGRGFDLLIDNANTGFVAAVDVAWGPVPELLEFQPLGGGASAKVKWNVTVRVSEVSRQLQRGTAAQTIPPTAGVGPGISIPATPDRLVGGLFLQLNYETTAEYGEDGFSSLSLRGTMEIPLSRTPITNRAITRTVDNLRSALEVRILSGIDLSRFRVTRRSFNISRDKRLMEWDYAIEEKPYMDLPEHCTLARGSYDVQPARQGMGLCTWNCSLRATYTLRKDVTRRIAWLNFLGLLRLRMQQSTRASIPELADAASQNPAPAANPLLGPAGAAYERFNIFSALQMANRLQSQIEQRESIRRDIARRPWLTSFSYSEGLYLDSKSITFSATWRLVTAFSHILLASGLWRKVPERDAQGSSLWALSVRDIQGVQSWLADRLDPDLDLIIDFGSVGV